MATGVCYTQSGNKKRYDGCGKDGSVVFCWRDTSCTDPGLSSGGVGGGIGHTNDLGMEGIITNYSYTLDNDGTLKYQFDNPTGTTFLGSYVITGKELYENDSRQQIEPVGSNYFVNPIEISSFTAAKSCFINKFESDDTFLGYDFEEAQTSYTDGVFKSYTGLDNLKSTTIGNKYCYIVIPGVTNLSYGTGSYIPAIYNLNYYLYKLPGITDFDYWDLYVYIPDYSGADDFLEIISIDNFGDNLLDSVVYNGGGFYKYDDGIGNLNLKTPKYGKSHSRNPNHISQDIKIIIDNKAYNYEQWNLGKVEFTFFLLHSDKDPLSVISDNFPSDNGNFDYTSFATSNTNTTSISKDSINYSAKYKIDGVDTSSTTEALEINISNQAGFNLINNYSIYTNFKTQLFSNLKLNNLINKYDTTVPYLDLNISLDINLSKSPYETRYIYIRLFYGAIDILNESPGLMMDDGQLFYIEKDDKYNAIMGFGIYDADELPKTASDVTVFNDGHDGYEANYFDYKIEAKYDTINEKYSNFKVISGYMPIIFMQFYNGNDNDILTPTLNPVRSAKNKINVYKSTVFGIYDAPSSKGTWITLTKYDKGIESINITNNDGNTNYCVASNGSSTSNQIYDISNLTADSSTQYAISIFNFNLFISSHVTPRNHYIKELIRNENIIMKMSLYIDNTNLILPFKVMINHFTNYN